MSALAEIIEQRVTNGLGYHMFNRGAEESLVLQQRLGEMDYQLRPSLQLIGILGYVGRLRNISTVLGWDECLTTAKKTCKMINGFIDMMEVIEGGDPNLRRTDGQINALLDVQILGFISPQRAVRVSAIR